jgi:hypothetical protein
MSRYVHLNPDQGESATIGDRRIREISQYQWSSLPGYGDEKRQDSWMAYETVLGYVGGSRQKYAGLYKIVSAKVSPHRGRSVAQMVLGNRDFLEKLKRMKVKSSPKDQPSYRMIQSIDAEPLIKQAANHFRLDETDLTRKRGRHPQERELVMELLHRYSGLSNG